jgi:hypothetical protein
MKPSEFMKSRFRQGVKALSAGVSYYSFTGTGANSGDAIESFASVIELPGLVSYLPSRASRERFGLELSFEAEIRIPIADLTEKGVTIKIGDAFVLPGTQQRFYVVGNPQADMQTSTGFQELVIPVNKRVGRRG